MAQVYEHPARPGQRLRVAAWIGAAIFLLIPLIAMQFTDEVAWSPADFAFAAILLLGSLGMFEWFARRTGNLAYRAGAAVSLAGVVLLVWIDAAVGIVGNESNPVNALFLAIPAIGTVVALLGRFRSTAMPRALFAMIVTQWVVAFLALGDRTGTPRDILGLTIAFTGIWLTAATLFARAPR